MVGSNSANNNNVHTRHMLQHNRVTLPKPLVTALNLEYTDKVDMALHNGGIFIKPKHIAAAIASKAAITKKKHAKTVPVTPKSTTITKTKKQQQKNKRRSLKQAITTTQSRN